MTGKHIIILTFVLGLALTTILGFSYYLYFGDPRLKNERLTQVEHYIVETQGTIDHVSEMETRWLSIAGDYDINVIYEDEPELTYVYLHNEEHGGILLTGIFEGEPFRSERLEEGKNGSLEEDGRDHGE